MQFFFQIMQLHIMQFCPNPCHFFPVSSTDSSQHHYLQTPVTFSLSAPQILLNTITFKHTRYLTFEVTTKVTIRTAVFWIVTSCYLVHRHHHSGRWPTWRTISSMICLSESSTCFQQLCAHPQEDNCINHLKKTRRLLYLKTQSVPRSKHFPCRL